MFAQQLHVPPIRRWRICGIVVLLLLNRGIRRFRVGWSSTTASNGNPFRIRREPLVIPSFVAKVIWISDRGAMELGWSRPYNRARTRDERNWTTQRRCDPTTSTPIALYAVVPNHHLVQKRRMWTPRCWLYLGQLISEGDDADC
jgi:hypothetical protein